MFFKKSINKLSRIFNLPRVPGYPIGAWIEPTTRCNVRCKTCGKFVLDEKYKDLDPEVYDKFVNQVLPHICEVILTGWGEPLLFPRFEELLQKSFEFGVKVIFITNGTLLTKEIIEDMVKHSGQIYLSVDGATKETFEFIRPQIKFEKIIGVLENIKKCSERLKNPNFKFSINFVAIRSNLSELIQMIELAHKYGAGELCVLNFWLGNRSDEFTSESLKYYPEMIDKIFPEAQTRALELGIKLILPYYGASKYSPENKNHTTDKVIVKKVPLTGCLKKPIFQKCYSPWRDVYITVEGGVRPCCMPTDYLGNLKMQSLKEIWNGENFQRLRKRIHTDNPPPYCRICNVAWGITGGDENYFAEAQEDRVC